MKALHIVLVIFMTLASVAVNCSPLPGSVRDTKDIDPDDWFEDVIGETLGMSVKELLTMTQNTFSDLNRATNSGLEDMDKILEQSSPEVKAELMQIRDKVVEDILNILAKLMVDLGNVLPKLSSVAGSTTNGPGSINEGPIQVNSAAADIIRAILGISLENFVIMIKNAFESSLNLLTTTIADFEDLAQRARPEVAQALRTISSTHLRQGQRIVSPVLQKFQQLVD